MILLLFLGTVVLPAVCWFLFIHWKDKSEPEQKHLVRRALIVGVVGVFIAMVVGGFFYSLFGLPIESVSELTDNNEPLLLIMLTVFLAGPIEELIKYVVLRYSVYFTIDFNQIFDGVVYGITIALAFSFVENIFYFIDLNSSMTTPMFVATVMFRGLFTTLMHITATGIIGYYLGKAKFSSSGRFLIITKGIVYGSLVHGFYNVLMSTDSEYAGIFGIMFILAVFIFFVRIWNKPDVRMVWKYVPPPT